MRVALGSSGAKAPPLAARPVKGWGAKSDTSVLHRILLYQAQDSSQRVAHQSPSVDGERQVSPIAHFCMQIVWEQQDPERG